jgi:hypothetical protein
MYQKGGTGLSEKNNQGGNWICNRTEAFSEGFKKLHLQLEKSGLVDNENVSLNCLSRMI